MGYYLFLFAEIELILVAWGLVVYLAILLGMYLNVPFGLKCMFRCQAINI